MASAQRIRPLTGLPQGAPPDRQPVFWPGPVLLDISRSLSRCGHDTPSGIDRVEAAYLTALRGTLYWGLARIAGGFVLLSAEAVAHVLAAGAEAPLDLRGRWPRRSVQVRRAESLARRLALARADRAGLGAMLRAHLPPETLALNVGHSNLSQHVLAALKEAAALRVVMIHDTIPLDHPDLARPAPARRFAARLHAAAQADLLLANSQHTAGQIAAWLRHWGLPIPPIEVLSLGITPPDMPVAPAAQPAFVMLGTVEPRKGHAMLLDIWARWGAAPPTLDVIGRMGWAGRELRRRLADPPPGVVCHGPLPDRELHRLMARARALLLPSTAEGFGLPLAEAMAMGLPAIVSDLPALRETGGSWPTYLEADDRVAWQNEIRRHSATDPFSGLTPPKPHAPMLWTAHFPCLGRVLTKFRQF
ncbi:MAG: glycosyltransferase [Pseudomonadota bacterium]